MERKLSESIKIDNGVAIASLPVTLSSSATTPVCVLVSKYNRILFAVNTGTRTGGASLSCQPILGTNAAGGSAVALGSPTVIITGDINTLIDVDLAGAPAVSVTDLYVGLEITEMAGANFVVNDVTIIRAPGRYNQATLPA